MSTLLLNLLQGGVSQVSEAPDIRCEVCGQTMAEFQKTGMLGCPACYDAFRAHLTPLLNRLPGSARHTGRAPARTEEQSHIRRKMDSIKREMDRAVAEEDFELAAKLRDELRAMTPAQENAGGQGPCVGVTSTSPECGEGAANSDELTDDAKGEKDDSEGQSRAPCGGATPCPEGDNHG
jgi:uncharacterized Zn finger protein (UPF0148 family)